MSYRLLTRPGCELCEDAALAIRFDGRLAVDLVDVDSHPDWKRRYGDRIPVLLDPQGLLLLSGRIDAESLSALWSRGGSVILRGAGSPADNDD